MLRDCVHGGNDTPAVILVVDDEPHMLVILTRILEGAGHDVLACSTCEQVEARLAGGLRPDIVITDVVLDGATGNRVAALVRRSSPHTKVVFMSGYDNIKVPGQHDLMPKPFSSREVIELVDRVRAAGGSATARSARRKR